MRFSTFVVLFCFKSLLSFWAKTGLSVQVFLKASKRKEGNSHHLCSTYCSCYCNFVGIINQSSHHLVGSGSEGWQPESQKDIALFQTFINRSNFWELTCNCYIAVGLLYYVAWIIYIPKWYFGAIVKYHFGALVSALGTSSLFCCACRVSKEIS